MAHRYLILDSQGNAVARGVSRQGHEGKIWCLVVEDGDMDQVMSHTHVRLVGETENLPGMEGRIVRREDERVYIETVGVLGEQVRKNLRIPVRFVSHIYPVSGGWTGRVPIVSKDLSCGGLAFFCPRALADGEVVQVVLPVTAQPLVLTMSILGSKTGQDGDAFYAARFLDLLREEESMVREAVFSLQLQNH